MKIKKETLITVFISNKNESNKKAEPFKLKREKKNGLRLGFYTCFEQLI